MRSRSSSVSGSLRFFSDGKSEPISLSRLRTSAYSSDESAQSPAGRVVATCVLSDDRRPPIVSPERPIALTS